MFCHICGSELQEGNRFCNNCGTPAATPAPQEPAAAPPAATPERSDAELERLAAQGDREAFAELYSRHSQRVYDFLLRLVRDPDEAADLMQETFLRAMRALSTEEKEAALWGPRISSVSTQVKRPPTRTRDGGHQARAGQRSCRSLVARREPGAPLESPSPVSGEGGRGCSGLRTPARPRAGAARSQ